MSTAEGEQVVEDSALDLLHWEKDDGTSVIPFFTSLEALQEAVATMESGGTDPDEITRLVDFLTGPASGRLSGRLIHVREKYLQYADGDAAAVSPEVGKLRRIPL